MESELIDYGDSKIRAAISWLIYPLCVLIPFGWLVLSIDLENPLSLILFAFLSLITAGAMEWLHPHTLRWRKSHADILADISHLVLSVPLSVLLRIGLTLGFFTIFTKATAFFTLAEWPVHWPLWAQASLGLIVGEFGNYWRHRLFHEWEFGWRIHSVHHSPKRLYFLNATRFHFVDLCLSGIGSSIPLALCGATPEVAALVGAFTGLHGNWQHGNVRYKLGWFNWIFAGAELHRWHHCKNIRHTNSNYGNNLIIFDTLFGTRALPAAPLEADQLGSGGTRCQLPEYLVEAIARPPSLERTF